MGQFGIGQPIKRFEDQRLLRGEGRFHNDVNLPGQAHAVIVRSPHAHARIRVDRHRGGARRARRGRRLHRRRPRAGRSRHHADDAQAQAARRLADVRAAAPRASPPDRVRYVGDPVAMVVAETLAQAEDAAERVARRLRAAALGDRRPRRPIGGARGLGRVPRQRLEPLRGRRQGGDRRRLREGAPRGRAAATSSPACTRSTWSRAARSASGTRARSATRSTPTCSIRTACATRSPPTSSRSPSTSIRVDRGRRRRRLRHQGLAVPRAPAGAVGRAEARPAGEVGVRAPRGDPRRRARARQRHRGGAGARRRRPLPRPARAARWPTSAPTSRPTATCSPPSATSARWSASTRSRPPTSQVLSVLTNTNSTAPYRGAGRPEATYVIERLIDDAARELGLDPRRAAAEEPHPGRRRCRTRTPLGVTYDCGDFAKSMEEALKLADVAGFAARREASRARGRLRGLGDRQRHRARGRPAAGVRRDPLRAERHRHHLHGHARTRARATRRRSSRSCTSGSASIPRDVRYIDGDTDRVAFGMGTMGSRSTVIGGTALWMAADKVIAKGKKIAAKLLEAAEADIAFADGRFAVAGTDRARHAQGGRARGVPARRSCRPASSRASTRRAPSRRSSDTWPNGCHVCEVEIDPDTGARRRSSRYVVVDDVGTVINPVTLKGQIHGGVAQGVGQALMEQVVYDAGVRPAPDRHRSWTTRCRAPTTFCDMHIESNPGADQAQPARRQGRGRGGHRRRAARRHQRGDGRARAARRARPRHAGHERARLAGHPGRRRRQTR